MAEIDLKPIFDYVDEKFYLLQSQFDEMKVMMSNVINLVDKYTKRFDDMHIEIMSHSYRLGRHDKWFGEIKDKIGVELKD